MKREGELWYAEGDIQNNLCRHIAIPKRGRGKGVVEIRALNTNHRIFGLLGRCERA